jgi:phosphatidylglycerophosphatase GEP4
MIFIGDRYLTDVVFGNRHGMLTIRVAPLTRQGEPVGVLLARLVEQACVSRWTAAGVKAPSNAAFSGAPAGACAFVRQPVSGAT